MTGLRVQIASFNANLQGAESTRPDLTPWLVPSVHANASSASPLAGSSGPSPLSAHHFRSTNPNTPSTHPTLPRDAPDFYAVGFQELVPLHNGLAATSGAALYNTDLDIRKTVRPHQAVVSGNGMYAEPEHGGGPESYALLCRVDLVGVALFVYARERVPAGSSAGRSAASRVKEIRKASVGTGIRGVMGNKGGVGVRIVVAAADGKGPDEVLTFVCAHLAAHDHNVERRNADWKQIVQRLVFAPSSVVKLPILQDSSASAGKAKNPTANNVDALQDQYRQVTSKEGQKKAQALDGRSYTLYDTTHVFVFGDLNHRIALGPSKLDPPSLASFTDEKSSQAEPLTKEKLASVLQTGTWADLQAHDQLTHQRLAPTAKAFHGLTELSIEEMGVPPTYKYKVVRDGDSSSGGKSKKSKKSKDVALQNGPAAAGEKKDGAASSSPLAGQELSKKRIPGWTDRVLWASAAGGGPPSPSAAGGSAFDKQGVEVEFFRSIMDMTHSDHKPITTLLRLPPPPQQTTTTTATLSSSNPFPPLPWLHRLLLSFVGTLLDRTVGWLWTFIILIGGGNLVGGVVELVVLAAITAWYLGAAPGGAGGDLSWWIYGARTAGQGQ